MDTKTLILQKAEEEKVSRNLVFKEYVHWAILDYLFRKGLFSDLVFQGGTALRMVYKGIRYSEDLDFVLKEKNTPFFENLSERLKTLPSFIEKNIPFAKNARLKTQKETQSFKRYHLILDTDFLPTPDRTNIELALIPSYTHQPIILHHQEMTQAPAVTVEQPHEILSDKLFAFAARDYVKGRDLWDIDFLMHTVNIGITNETISLIKHKISDYGSTVKTFKASLTERLSTLKEKGPMLLEEEMDRFLPQEYRKLFGSRYNQMCCQQTKVLRSLIKDM